LLSWLFFFQAEDRIRDRNVTGVQTCALPILQRLNNLKPASQRITPRIVSFLNPWSDPLGSGFQIIQSLYAIGPGGLLGQGFLNRSEERRVGKASIGGWAMERLRTEERE